MATVSKSQLHFIPIDLEEDDSWLSPGLQGDVQPVDALLADTELCEHNRVKDECPDCLAHMASALRDTYLPDAHAKATVAPTPQSVRSSLPDMRTTSSSRIPKPPSAEATPDRNGSIGSHIPSAATVVRAFVEEVSSPPAARQGAAARSYSVSSNTHTTTRARHSYTPSVPKRTSPSASRPMATTLARQTMLQAAPQLRSSQSFQPSRSTGPLNSKGYFPWETAEADAPRPRRSPQADRPFDSPGATASAIPRTEGAPAPAAGMGTATAGDATPAPRAAAPARDESAAGPAGPAGPADSAAAEGTGSASAAAPATAGGAHSASEAASAPQPSPAPVPARPQERDITPQPTASSASAPTAEPKADARGTNGSEQSVTAPSFRSQAAQNAVAFNISWGAAPSVQSSFRFQQSRPNTQATPAKIGSGRLQANGHTTTSPSNKAQTSPYSLRSNTNTTRSSPPKPAPVRTIDKDRTTSSSATTQQAARISGPGEDSHSDIDLDISHVQLSEEAETPTLAASTNAANGSRNALAAAALGVGAGMGFGSANASATEPGAKSNRASGDAAAGLRGSPGASRSPSPAPQHAATRSPSPGPGHDPELAERLHAVVVSHSVTMEMVEKAVQEALVRERERDTAAARQVYEVKQDIRQGKAEDQPKCCGGCSVM